MTTLVARLTDIQDRLDALARQHGVPGAVLAIGFGGELLDFATGVINVNTGVATTPDSVFQIGSNTKLFTTTLIMQLSMRATSSWTNRSGATWPTLPWPTGRPPIRSRSGSCSPTRAASRATTSRASAGATRPSSVWWPRWSISTWCTLPASCGRTATRASWWPGVWPRSSPAARITALAAPDLRPSRAQTHDRAGGRNGRPALRRGAHGRSGRPPEGPPGGGHGVRPRPAGSMTTATAAELVRFTQTHLGGGTGLDGGQILSKESVGAMQQVQMRQPPTSRPVDPGPRLAHGGVGRPSGHRARRGDDRPALLPAGRTRRGPGGGIVDQLHDGRPAVARSRSLAVRGSGGHANA